MSAQAESASAVQKRAALPRPAAAQSSAAKAMQNSAVHFAACRHSRLMTALPPQAVHPVLAPATPAVSFLRKQPARIQGRSAYLPARLRRSVHICTLQAVPCHIAGKISHRSPTVCHIPYIFSKPYISSPCNCRKIIFLFHFKNTFLCQTKKSFPLKRKQPIIL